MACQCGERGCWADKRKKFLRYQQRLERGLAIGKKNGMKEFFPPFFDNEWEFEQTVTLRLA